MSKTKNLFVVSAKSMKKDNYYDLLQVSRDASKEEIKQAYRKKAMELHPDRNKGNKESEEMFKKVTEAYEVLSNEDERAYYDRTGTVKGNRTSNSNYANYDFATIVNTVFGNSFFFDGSDPNTTYHNTYNVKIHQDIKLTLTVSLEDVLEGKEKKVVIKRQIACDSCQGKGYTVSQNTCKKCNGSGSVRINSGLFVFQSTCPDCGGVGYSRLNCSKCQGKAYSLKEEIALVKIPQNARPITVLKIPNKGNEVYSLDSGNTTAIKKTGDCYVVIDYIPTQDGITLNNGNLYMTISVPFDTILSEEEITIDVFKIKRIKLKLDSNNHSGYQYVVRGEGIGKDKDAFIEVFIDASKNKINEANKKKLVKVIREVYGNPITTFQPISIASSNHRRH